MQIAIAMLVLYLNASGDLFRKYPQRATAYLSDCVDMGCDLYHSTYALGCCLFENERYDDALGMFERH